LGSGGENADVYANLGLAYAQLGGYKLAIESWTRSLRLKPNSFQVLNNLVWLLTTANDPNVRDTVKAIELAHRACELTEYKDPMVLDTLASAYAAAGRFDDAVTTAEQAVNAAKARGQEDLAGEIQKRIELYKASYRYIQK
jgi:tetratricopeptide (TPR) repeat protein